MTYKGETRRRLLLTLVAMLTLSTGCTGREGSQDTTQEPAVSETAGGTEAATPPPAVGVPIELPTHPGLTPSAPPSAGQVAGGVGMHDDDLGRSPAGGARTGGGGSAGDAGIDMGLFTLGAFLTAWGAVLLNSRRQPRGRHARR